MARRKGMMVGSGKRGYHNIISKDPKVHSDSAKGRKQSQRINTTPKIPQRIIYARVDRIGEIPIITPDDILYYDKFGELSPSLKNRINKINDDVMKLDKEYIKFFEEKNLPIIEKNFQKKRKDVMIYANKYNKLTPIMDKIIKEKDKIKTKFLSNLARAGKKLPKDLYAYQILEKHSPTYKKLSDKYDKLSKEQGKLSNEATRKFKFEGNLDSTGDINNISLYHFNFYPYNLDEDTKKITKSRRFVEDAYDLFDNYYDRKRRIFSSKNWIENAVINKIRNYRDMKEKITKKEHRKKELSPNFLKKYIPR